MSESSLGLTLVSVVLILFACQFGESSAVSVKYRQNEATGDTVTTSSSNPELSFITVDHPNSPTSESSTSTSNATSHVYFHQQFPADNESEPKQIVPNAEVAEGEEGGEQEDENNSEQTTIQSTIPTPAIEAPSGFGSGALSASLVADLNNRNLTSSETRQHYLGYEPNNWNSYSTDIDHHDGISKRQAQYPLDVVNGGGGGGGAAQEDERTSNDEDYDGDSSDEGSNDDGNGDYDSDDEPSEDQAAQGGGNSGGGDNGGNSDDGTDGEFGMSDQDDADFDQENSASFSVPKFDSVSNDDNSIKTTPNTNNDNNNNNNNNNNNKNNKNGCKTVYKQIETVPFSGDKTVTQLLHRSRRSILDSGMDDFEEIFADDELGENENPKKSSSTSSSYMISSECHYDGNGKLEKNQKKNTGAGGAGGGEKDSKTANNNNSDNQISSKPKSKSMIQSQIENPSTIAVPTTIVPTIPTGFQAGAAESSFMATDDDMESSDSIRGAMHDTLNLPRRRNLMASYVSNNEMGHSMDFQMPFSSNAKFHRFPYPHYHIYYDQSPTASLVPDEREQAIMKRQQRLHARRQHNSPIYNNEDDIGSLEQPVEYIDNVPDQQNNDNGEEAATVGEGLDENAVEESDDELDLGVRKSRQRRSRPNLYAYEDNYSQGPKSTDRPKNIEYGYYREIVDQPSIVKTSTSKPKSLSSSLLSGGGSSERSQGAIADKYRINSGDAIDTVAPVKRSRRRMKKSTSDTATNEPLNDDGDSGYDDGGDGEQGDGSNDDGNADYSSSYGGGSYDEYDSDKDRGNEGGDESGGSSNGDENGQQEDDREDDY